MKNEPAIEGRPMYNNKDTTVIEERERDRSPMKKLRNILGF